MMSGRQRTPPWRDRPGKPSHVVSEPGSEIAMFFPDTSVGKPGASDLGSTPSSATTTYTGSPRNPFNTVTCTDGPRNLSTTTYTGSSWNLFTTTPGGGSSRNPSTIPGPDSPRNLSTTPGGSPRNPLSPKEPLNDAGFTHPEIGNLGKMPNAKVNVEPLLTTHIEADNMLLAKSDVGYAPVEVNTMQKESSNTVFQGVETDGSPEEPQTGPMNISATPDYFILTTPGFPTQ